MGDAFFEMVLNRLELMYDLSTVMCFGDSLEQVLNQNLPRRACVISASNANHIEKRIREGKFYEFPFIIVHPQLLFSVYTSVSKYEKVKIADNQVYESLHSAKALSGHIQPYFYIYGLSRKDVAFFANAVVACFNRPKVLYAPLDDRYRLFITVEGRGHIDEDKVERTIYADGKRIYSILIKLPEKHIAVPIHDYNVFGDCLMKRLRVAQLGSQTSKFCSGERKLTIGSSRKWGRNDISDDEAVKDAIANGVSLYKQLMTTQQGIAERINLNSWTDAYKKLRQDVLNNNQDAITWDSVNKAFPFHSTLYPRLRLDILNRTDVATVNAGMWQSYREYKELFDFACNYLNLPNDVNVKLEEFSTLNPNMRSLSGFKYVVESLSKNIRLPIGTIIEKYRSDVAENAMLGYEINCNNFKHDVEKHREERANRELAREIAREERLYRRGKYYDYREIANCRKNRGLPGFCQGCGYYSDCIFGKGSSN